MTLTPTVSDPEDPTHTQNITWAWSCVTLIVGETVVEGDACPFNVPTSASPLIKAPNSMPVGTYRFKVTASKGSRSSNQAAADVEVTPGGPSVYVPLPPCSTCGSGAHKVSPSKKITLTGAVETSSSSTLTLAWSEPSELVPGTAFYDATEQAVWFSTGVTGLQLIINAGVLSPGATYTFQLSATDTFGSSSWTASFVVNEPPTGSGLAVSPEVGEVFDTVFTISAVSWEDEDLPLTFLFRYAVTTDLATFDGTIVNINAQPVLATTTSARLPLGVTSAGNQLTVIAVVADVHGASSRASTNVTVNAVAVDPADTPQYVQDNVTKTLAEIIAGGNEDDASSGVNSGSSILNDASNARRRRLRRLLADQPLGTAAAGAVARHGMGGARRLSGEARQLATAALLASQAARYAMLQSAIAASALMEVSATALESQIGMLAGVVAYPEELNGTATQEALTFLADSVLARYLTLGEAVSEEGLQQALLVIAACFESDWGRRSTDSESARLAVSGRVYHALGRLMDAALVGAVTGARPVSTSTASVSTTVSAAAAAFTKLTASTGTAATEMSLPDTGGAAFTVPAYLQASDWGVLAGSVLSLQAVRLPFSMTVYLGADGSAMTSTAPSVLARAYTGTYATGTMLSVTGLRLPVKVLLPQDQTAVLPSAAQERRCMVAAGTSSSAFAAGGCVPDPVTSTASVMTCLCNHMSEFTTMFAHKPVALLSTGTAALAVTEASGGNTATVDVTLNAAPTADVTVTVTLANGYCLHSATATPVYTSTCAADVDCSVGHACVTGVFATASPASLTFTAANYGTPQTVTVTASDDKYDELATHSTAFSLSTNSASDLQYKTQQLCAEIATGGGCARWTGAAKAATTVDVTDDDSAGLEFSVTGPISATEGETAGTAQQFGVRLTSRPFGSVTLAAAGDTQSQVAPSTLSFAARTESWNVYQTLTVTAVDDAFIESSPHSGTISIPMTSTDPAYTAAAAAAGVAKMSVAVTDNDVAGVSFSKSTLSLQEDGGVDTYAVQLLSSPSAPVVVTLSATPVDVTLSTTTAHFDATTWNVPVQVVVTGIADGLVQGDRAVVLSHTVATTDPNWSSLAPASVVVTVVDDDVPGVELKALLQPVDLPEGTSSTYTLQLGTQPSNPVTVTVTGFDAVVGVTVEPEQLVFDSSTWAIPQVVTVAAPADDIDNDDATFSLSHTITTGDSTYAALPAEQLPKLEVQVRDDDFAGLWFSSAAVAVTEGLNPTGYLVALQTEPVGDVTVTVSGVDTARFTVTPSQLVFSRGTINDATWWQAPRAFTVAPVDDTLDQKGAQEFSLTHGVVAPSDVKYNGAFTTVVSLTVNDDDGSSVIVSKAEVVVTEGNELSDSYTLRLSSQPSSPVTIALAMADPADEGQVMVEPKELVFTKATYNLPHKVAVSGVQDEVDEGESATYSIKATVTSDVESYNGLNVQSVSVRVIDDDFAALLVPDQQDMPGLGVAPVSVMVRLGTKPQGNVTITATGFDATRVAVEAVVVTPETWQQEHALVVRPVFDEARATLPALETGMVFRTSSTADAQYNQALLAETRSMLVAAHTNLPPVTNAGAAQTYVVDTSGGASTATLELDGSGTVDVDSTTITFSWELVSASPSTASATIVAPSSATSSVILDTIGASYTFRLTATDVVGNSASADTQLHVPAIVAAPSVGSASTVAQTSEVLVSLQIRGVPKGATVFVALFRNTKAQALVRELVAPVPDQLSWRVGATAYPVASGVRLGAVVRLDGIALSPGSFSDVLVAYGPVFDVVAAYSWSASAWGECIMTEAGATCGAGRHTRNVVCVNNVAGGTVASQKNCLGAKPSTSEDCLVECQFSSYWALGAWGTCSATCGGGTQERTVACIDPSGNVATDCTTTEPASKRECNTFVCQTYSWSYTKYDECSATCGGGTQARNAFCTDSSGSVVASALCSSLTQASLKRECNTQQCADRFWLASATWSACDKPCSGGTSTRSVQCINAADSSVVEDALCTAAGEKPSASRACNTAPCEVYALQVGAWPDCTGKCGVAVARNVTCVSESLVEVDATNCAHLAVQSTTVCRSCPICSSLTSVCGGHGDCHPTQDQCVCETNFFGDFCQIQAGCTGVPDRNGQCCEGVLNLDDSCCVGDNAVIDSRGECCASGEIDACGVCQPEAGQDTSRVTVAVDAQGVCCLTALDAGGLCCASGNVDSCGVCDGFEGTCAVEMDLEFEVPAGIAGSDLSDPLSTGYSTVDTRLRTHIATALGRTEAAITLSGLALKSRRMRLLTALATGQPARLLAGESGVVTATVQPEGNYVDPGTASTTVTGDKGENIVVNSVSKSSVAGVCGNGACEINERCDSRSPEQACCPSDCPLPIVGTCWRYCCCCCVCVFGLF